MKEKTDKRPNEYELYFTEKQLAQMKICLNCTIPAEYCNGEPKTCKKIANRAMLREKQLHEASGEELKRLQTNKHNREYQKRRREQCNTSF